jgi:amidohydrolase/hippurate hydrolase
MTDIIERVRSLAHELVPEITDFRRDLHRHPELAFKEKRTTARIKQALAAAGVGVADLPVETGVLGLLRGNRPGGSGQVVALRADIDALPVLEDPSRDYSSINQGIMHACGHDGHTAILLGAARILAQMRDELSSPVKFIFQPAEEILQGAKHMIEAGVLDDPPVDYIFALHSWPELPTGKIAFYPGVSMASADRFLITLRAGGTHGAYPHHSPDTVLAAADVVQRLHCIISREVEVHQQAVLSVCMLHAGSAFNIIPKQVELGGILRCLDMAVREQVAAAIERVVQGVSASNACQWELQISHLVPQLKNSPEALRAIRASTERVLGPGLMQALPYPTMGSEDFSLYLERMPRGALVRIGVTPQGGKPTPLHSDRFLFDDGALENGMAVLAQTVLDLQ